MSITGRILIAAALALASPAFSHEIYTGVKGKFGNICCGANDCSLTTYRENGDQFEFLTREGHWVSVPQDRISFIAIPGDPPHSDTHAGHLCYGPVIGYERGDDLVSGEGQTVHLYCAFVIPGVDLTMTALIPYAGAPAEVISAYRKGVSAATKAKEDNVTGGHYKPVPSRLLKKKPVPPSPAPVIPEGLKEEFERAMGVLRVGSIIAFRDIVSECAAEFGVSIHDLKSDRRSGDMFPARHVIFYLGRKRTILSLPTLARLLGRRDHTTVMHGIWRAETRIARDPELAKRVACIEARLDEKKLQAISVDKSVATSAAGS